MRNTRSLLAAVASLSAALVGCSPSSIDQQRPPWIASVLPSCVESSAATAVILRGEFPGSSSNSSLQPPGSATPPLRAWLSNESTQPTELYDVVQIDGSTVKATIPASLAPGRYSVAVERRDGARANSVDAVEVRAGGCAAPVPSLSIAVYVQPNILTVGQETTVTVVVTNAGQSALGAAVPYVHAPSGFDATALSDPAEVAAGATVTFTSKYKPRTVTDSRGATFTVDVSGVDVLGATVRSDVARSSVVMVHPGAYLRTSTRSPSVLYAGLEAKIALLFTNDGAAPAVVSPVLSATASDGARVHLASPASRQEIAPLGDLLLEWSLSVDSPCTVAIDLDVSDAFDLNSGARLNLDPLPAITVRTETRPVLVVSASVHPIGRSDDRIVSGGSMSVGSRTLARHRPPASS